MFQLTGLECSIFCDVKPGALTAQTSKNPICLRILFCNQTVDFYVAPVYILNWNCLNSWNFLNFLELVKLCEIYQS